MAVSLRQGTFGSYYGNDFNSSNALNYEQMKVNVTYIYSYLTNKGWSVNAISAMCGNMQAESSINPGRWQSDRVGGETSGHGYGLVQWTPYTKYTEWVSGDPSTMDNNLSRIIYEVENKLQWIATSKYNYSFKEFSTSNKSVSELAIAFLLNYERPADQSVSVQNYRSGLAENWYTYLTGIEPTPPSEEGSSITKKHKYNFILFNRRKRHGQR